MSLNIPRLTQLRDFLARLDPSRFDMNYWRNYHPTPHTGSEGVDNNQLLHDCGTCACIGGWTEALFNNPETPVDAPNYVHAAQALDLTPEEAHQLFYPADYGTRHEVNLPRGASYETITLAQAIQTLDKIIANPTAPIDWSHAHVHSQ